VARGLFPTVAGVVQPSPAPRFSATPSEITAAPPEAGQHGDDILRECGYSDAEIVDLRRSTVK